MGLVRYSIQGAHTSQSMYVSGGNVTNTTLSSLMLSNAYAIEVAAVNFAGTGVFSPTILTMIKPSKCSVASNALLYVTHTTVENLARILLLRSSQLNLVY